MIRTTLSIEYDALEPYISRKCFESHYYMHYMAYMRQLDLANLNGTELVQKIRFEQGTVQYNAIQAWNHEFMFSALKKGSCYPSEGILTMAVAGSFGSFRFFRDAFLKYALISNRHGWIWLVLNQYGALEIYKETKSNHPLLKNVFPLMNCDLWEHAYSMDYQHHVRAYVENYLKVIDWNVVESRYKAAIGQLSETSAISHI